MKPVIAASTSQPVPIGRTSDAWRERSALLFVEFEPPARAMVRRAFRGAFSDDELDDIYSNAWVGTLRSLATRHEGLSDEEIRSYVFTAVANQASRELRRRRRKPTAPLDFVEATADAGAAPEDLAVRAESSRVTRDLLVSMPPRRRAVMLLRYGWGLEPKQICGLISGLSPRAYRKEVTKGVDELTEKLRSFERGEWCSEREPVLKVYAAGLADPETERQAQAHLAHCRECSTFVARLSGHLHDLGVALAIPAALDGIDAQIPLLERGIDAAGRVRDALAGLVSKGPTPGSEDIAVGIASSGAVRGAGVAGAGALAKLSGFGITAKLSVACIGGAAALTACVAAGLAPISLPGGGKTGPERVGEVRAGELAVLDRAEFVSHAAARAVSSAAASDPQRPASGPDRTPAGERGAAREQDGGAAGGDATATGAAAPQPAPATAPVVEQEFGVASAAPVPVTAPSADHEATSAAGTVREEFGP